MAFQIMGDVLEGGGQILRISVSLSAILCKPVHITNIRAGRKKPGLASQHLNGVKLVEELCNGKTTGVTLGSTNLNLLPSTLLNQEDNFIADAQSAGSISLLMQVSLPCCLFSNSRRHITLKGGTNADMAPPIDYNINVLLPILERFGASVHCKIKRRGFYPVGGGEVSVTIEPVKTLNSVQILEFGEVKEISGVAYFSGRIPEAVAKKMADAATKVIRTKLRQSAVVKVIRFNDKEAVGSGCGINLICKSTTGCILGAGQISNPRASPEKLGRMAAEELLENVENHFCVDQHLQDQLIIFMALAEGTSAIKIGAVTLHTETAIHVATQLCDAKFRITKDGVGNIIECDGIGWRNRHYAKDTP